MTTDTALLQQALDALENCYNIADWPGYGDNEQSRAIDAIKARLAQPEQEPFEIEWPEYHDMGMGCGLEDRNITDRYDAMRYGWDEAIEAVAQSLPEKLYIYPQPERKPLTKEEIEQEHDRSGRDQSNVGLAEFISGVRFAEIRHGIWNKE
jgi:hypothetical protein